LSHPHIGAIYGLEEAGDSKALVLELVEGPRLADRIADGPIPVDEALPIARQIAEALEAAHAKGVVHRDLKPANIKLRDDGTVKVLDFGLAKAMDPTSGQSSNLSLSPTITSPAMTQAGLILGTAAYMSPEQAKGKAVDKRADVWAFGAVLFEMLTGRRAFAGDEVSDVLASVLAREPQLAAIPDGVPARVRQVLKACLQKDPKQRIHDMADVRLAMDGAFESPRDADAGSPAAATAPASRWRALSIAASVLLAAALAGVAAWTLKPVSPGNVMRFAHRLGEETFTRTGRPVLAISRDARHVAYVANNQIYLRNLDDTVARPIAGTNENPSSPVFSPDGAWIAYWSTTGELKKIQITGGTPIPLAKAGNPLGISWAVDDRIVYGQENGIWRVSSNGGVAEQIVKLADGERAHAPQMMPDGDAVLFTLATSEGSTAWDDGDIVVQSIASGERKPVHHGGADPRYLPGGYLVYVSEGTLFAVRFDPNGPQVLGGAVPVVNGVQRAIGAPIGIAQYAVSESGAIVYISGGAASEVDLAMIDRAGRPRVLSGSTGPNFFPRLSPDDTKIAVERGEGDSANIWIYDIPQAQWRQITFEGGQRPVWTRKGDAITFLRGEELWQIPVDFGGVAEKLPGTLVRGSMGPHAWSPTEDVLLHGSPDSIRLYTPGKAPAPESNGESNAVLPLPDGTTTITRVRFSPDGRWLTFSAGAGGTPYVYVAPFPFRPGGHRRITNMPSGSSIWSRNGRELYALTPGLLHVLEISTTPSLTWTNPKELFPITQFGPFTRTGITNYDVAKSGEFVATIAPGVKPGAEDTRPEIQIVLNWFEELKRVVP
jgi:serine/threonine-protein kinase